jgi:hypothetical protein
MADEFLGGTPCLRRGNLAGAVTLPPLENGEVPAVRQKLADHIKSCLERAEQCRSAAALAPDPEVRTQLLDLEERWRHVAKTYEFVVSLEHFLLDQHKHAMPKELEKLLDDAADT